GLETVEVDQMNCEVPIAFAHAHKHVVDPLAELGAVGQAGEFVILCQMRDALLRAFAFGYVFEDDHGTAASHHPARYRDGPIAVGRSLNLVEGVALKAAQQVVEDRLYTPGFVIAGANAVTDQLG